jgi:hypothetical protein
MDPGPPPNAPARGKSGKASTLLHREKKERRREGRKVAIIMCFTDMKMQLEAYIPTRTNKKVWVFFVLRVRAS